MKILPVAGPLIAVILLCAAGSARAAAPLIDLPLADYPYNWDYGYRGPSMRQSLELSKDFYHYGHEQLHQLFLRRPAWRYLTTAAFDFLAIWLPPGSAWVHEEWHRAVMGRYGIDSYNEVYRFNLFADSISVSKVRDEDLARLKRQHPADMVRMHIAGSEAQLELNLALEKDIFFRDARAWSGVVRWENYVNVIGYLQLCDSEQADTDTREFLASEDTHIGKRDFTGLDCDGWVYDLFRPDEAYAARGAHPSGVGIDRYIQYSDLTRQEKDYLHRQYLLSYLNLANPFLLEFHRFAAGNPRGGRAAAWNLALRHHLTSFGYTVDANFFWRDAATKLLFTAHHYANKQHLFPGFDLELLDYPASLFGRYTSIDLRAGLWRQPQDQGFTTSHGQAGGHAGLRLNFPLGSGWLPYVEVAGKTAGWQAGTVYLQSQLESRLGIRWTLR